MTFGRGEGSGWEREKWRDGMDVDFCWGGWALEIGAHRLGGDPGHCLPTFRGALGYGRQGITSTDSHSMYEYSIHV